VARRDRNPHYGLHDGDVPSPARIARGPAAGPPTVAGSTTAASPVGYLVACPHCRALVEADTDGNGRVVDYEPRSRRRHRCAAAAAQEA
jgi:hypothetical protein